MCDRGDGGFQQELCSDKYPVHDPPIKWKLRKVKMNNNETREKKSSSFLQRIKDRDVPWPFHINYCAKHNLNFINTHEEIMVHCHGKICRGHFEVNTTWHLNQPIFNEHYSPILSSRCSWASRAWATACEWVRGRVERVQDGSPRGSRMPSSQATAEMPFAITFGLYHNSNLTRSMLQSIEKLLRHTQPHTNYFLSFFFFYFVFIPLIRRENRCIPKGGAWCQLWKWISEFNYWGHFVFPDKVWVRIRKERVCVE